MVVDMYMINGSPPCGTVMFVAKALNVKLNIVEKNYENGDLLKPDFIKLNPQHTVPTINDNGYILWESRAIITYLADKYGKDDALYPKDPQKRALVNQRLFFDFDLYNRLADYYYGPMFSGEKRDPTKLPKIENMVKFLETFLDGKKFVAGNNLTLADLSIAVTLATLDLCGFKLDSYPNVAKFFKEMVKMPGYADSAGLMIGYFKEYLDANKITIA